MSRSQSLLEQLERGPSLTIRCHDDPDPDCITSALALESIAEQSGVADVVIQYDGSITHHQNRALVNLLDVDIERCSSGRLDSDGLLAFVDHSIPGRHNSVPPEQDVDIVIDHHPTDEPVPAEFVDVREGYGATATIMVEYFRELELEMSTRVATGLLFGLHRERIDYIRRPNLREYEAACYLFPSIDMDLLRQLYGASFSRETVEAVGEAVQNRISQSSCLVSRIGRTTNRDAIAQAAEYLLNTDGIDTVLVWGIVEDEIQLSARSIDPGVDIGRRLDEAFDGVGSAGGHHDMGGGQIPLGIFADVAGDDGELVEMVSKRISRRYFDTLGLAYDENRRDGRNEGT